MELSKRVVKASPRLQVKLEANKVVKKKKNVINKTAKGKVATGDKKKR